VVEFNIRFVLLNQADHLILQVMVETIAAMKLSNTRKQMCVMKPTNFETTDMP
jgi:hypothetical protein